MATGMQAATITTEPMMQMFQANLSAKSPRFAPQRLPDQRSGGVGKSVGGQIKKSLLSGWSDSEQPEESFPVLGNHGGQAIWPLVGVRRSSRTGKLMRHI